MKARKTEGGLIAFAGLSAVALAVILIWRTCTVQSSPPVAEPRFRYSLLDNGDFQELNTTAARRIPWWRSARGPVHLIRLGGGAPTEERDWISQPLAFYAPLAATLRLRGDVDAGGMIAIFDQEGRSVSDLSTGMNHGHEFQPLSGALEDLVPRLDLRVIAPNGDAQREPGAWVRRIEAEVDLPCPSEAALRAELVGEIDKIFTTWLERGSDDVGPRTTAFLAKEFDAVTGKPLRAPPATGFNSFYQALFEASAVEDRPAWKAAFAAFFDDFLALQLHPATGLPRGWNPILDTPIDDAPTEIALVFGFLIDVAERGPQAMRERAQTAALKIGETVVANGLLPDGNCAASYWPATGKPNLNVNQLRRLDVPLQLVRLSKLVGDERFAIAAREPLATLEFTNYWHGTWDAIDPGFDDNFGHYGARAARAAREVPTEMLYRRFALEGWKHYEPIWRDALRFGGNVAADQVRCWRIGTDLARVEPSLKETMGPLLRLAARSHFKGGQFSNGAWGDVTIFDFQPKDALQVNDFSGTPQNLLTGLATIYVDEIGLRTDEIRAMYTAVFRSTMTQHRRPYGYLLTRETAGSNSAYGSIRVLSGLVEMLTALSRPK